LHCFATSDRARRRREHRFTDEIKNQSQLYGLLDRPRDLGHELISVQPQAEAGGATEEDQTPRDDLTHRKLLPGTGHQCARGLNSAANETCAASQIMGSNEGQWQKTEESQRLSALSIPDARNEQSRY
jgi:hypothetical protein